MNRLVLANFDYTPRDGGGHMTDEGHQLQVGLGHAGWTLAGWNYGDGCTDVPTLVERHEPEVVFIQDRRDWDRNNPGGSFGNRNLHFERIERLADYADLTKVAVVKDAGSMTDYQRRSVEEVGADAVVIYYHPQSVLALSPWLKDYALCRTYHSVDAAYVRTLDLSRPRRRAIVTGAVSNVYPLRQMAIRHADRIGLYYYRHPGYGNRGCQTPHYVKMLAEYRVHLATASAYKFALRKIIESVAVGCTPVTDLPDYDVLPEIDGALVRVSAAASVDDLRDAVAKADREWDLDKARHWSEKCLKFYDWKAVGWRLSDLLMKG